MKLSDRTQHTQILAQKRILIIDDSADIRDSLAEFLRLENYDVTAASDGQAALDYLRAANKNPDLIILDLLMPGLSGYEFLNQKKLMPEIYSLKVVIMTANQLEDAKNLGTEGFLRKPFAVNDLLKLIAELLGDQAYR